MNDPEARLKRVNSVGGCLVRTVAWGLAGLFMLLSVVSTTGSGNGLSPYDVGLHLVAVAAAIGALIQRHMERWAFGTALASVVLTMTIGFRNADIDNPSVILEVCGLLVLVARVVWKVPRDRLVAMTALTGGAVVALPFRASPWTTLLFSAPLAVLVAVAIGAGLYLRALDAQRARTLDAARRDERLELARDLHDFVAHHVTGIVVQAQAARFAAQPGTAQSPEQLDRMFAGIEKAGTEALTSMRRMVGLLREAQDGAGGEEGGTGSTTRPVGDLAQVEELVDGFTDPPATLHLDPGLGALPPEVATSVHRVVQEALTNARKHAADATAVTVSVARRPDGSVEIAVRDDGRGASRRLPSSGFGLAGLGERVEALHGRLYAGPRPEGGWEVVAVLPTGGSLGESRP
ncbi:histidine kinase [Actinomadura kijaniata]|uniref:histidine kinase n=1 Tax=Actinomadura namibiensis TaxID=182080 RepID=A0A7W3LMS4_ACTNM|nr:histidine kinase [Actinomadura namibiensis]MBA8950989.1 signal transduction histidine kinase [Actinomadura namibiensis]